MPEDFFVEKVLIGFSFFFLVSFSKMCLFFPFFEESARLK